MVTDKNIIEKLEIEKQKWTDKIYGVGETRVDLMIDDAIRVIKNQQKEIEELKIEKEQVLNDYQDLGKELAFNFVNKDKVKVIIDNHYPDVAIVKLNELFESEKSLLEREAESLREHIRFLKKHKEFLNNN